jgi:hypothetical protein
MIGITVNPSEMYNVWLTFMESFIYKDVKLIVCVDNQEKNSNHVYARCDVGINS